MSNCEHEEKESVTCYECGAYRGDFCTYCKEDCTPDHLSDKVRECECEEKSAMTDQEKSVMLARMAGFKVMNTMNGEPRRVFCNPDGYQVGGSIYHSVAKNLTRDEEFSALCPDFYNPANMALLATALAWFAGVSHWEPHIGKWAKWMQHFTDGMAPLHLHEWMCKSADAGIRLAIEAGLVETA